MSFTLTQAVDWGVALVPVLLLLGVFNWLDAYKLMNLREIAALLLLGAIGALVAWPVSGRLLDALPIGFSLYSRFVAPWIEEAIKGALIIGLFRLNRIGYKLDAVISGFAIGAGFSVVENIFYLTLYPAFGTGTWLVRGFGTAIMHGTTLAVFASMAHEFAERDLREAADYDFHLLWFIPGYGAAVALHTAFNQFANHPMTAMLGAVLFAPIVLIGILNFGTAEAQHWLAEECAAHHIQLDALRAGRWPDGVAGEKIASLAARVDPQSAQRIRRYWEVQAWLVAEAEDVLIEEAARNVAFDRSEVRAAIVELEELKKSLGRSTYTALHALLPFSRNDLWEVGELRQRLGRR